MKALPVCACMASVAAAAALFGVAASAQQSPAGRSRICATADHVQDADARRLADAITSADRMFRFLSNELGGPATCHPSVSRDGDFFRISVEFRWSSGVTLLIAHTSPEINETIVQSSQGLSQLAGIERAFEDYARHKGLAIDWSKPERTERDGVTTLEYQDPEPGLNGIARKGYEGSNKLVLLSLSTAP